MIKPNRTLSAGVLSLGFLFLYIPIISLVVYSFNESKLVTVWSGFSLKWYAALLQDDELLTAAWLSLRIGLMTAFASVVIGTWAGFVLARMGRFRGFTLFAGMINAPLVIPEVIQGISLLLLFVAMEQLLGWPKGRGVITMWIGHVMLCVSYVAIIVQSRVKEMNRSLEEAALDLGATPLKVFFVITLPLVVFSRVRLGLNPEMNALATLFISAVTIGVIAANQFMAARERKRTRDMQIAVVQPDPVDTPASAVTPSARRALGRGTAT